MAVLIRPDGTISGPLAGGEQGIRDLLARALGAGGGPEEFVLPGVAATGAGPWSADERRPVSSSR